MATITRDLHCINCGYNLRGLEESQLCPECGKPYDVATMNDRWALLRIRLTLFDKFCAVLAIVIALVFVLLGLMGLFIGCSANFTLPPILGVAPALVGWGILRAIVVAWRASRVSDLALSGK